MDRISKEHRSWNMSRIRGKNTAPELAVRSMLHRMGYRFRLHPRELPGVPDLVLPRFRTVVFVNGCFWHRHNSCQLAYSPKTRVTFWQDKFRDTIKRDEVTCATLRLLGWHVLIVWQCELADKVALAKRLHTFLQSTLKSR